MSRYDRNQIVSDLKHSIIEVTFTKASGEQRIMHATLDPRYLPPNTNIDHLDQEHSKPEHDNIVVCWDVQKGGWRSFRIENVTYCQELSGLY